MWDIHKDFGVNKRIENFKIDCNESMSYVDIGILRVDGAKNRTVHFYPKNRDGESVPVFSSLREPLSYPLLFSRGERGWGKDNNKLMDLTKKISATEYLAAMTLHNLENIKLNSKMYGSENQLAVSRFQALPRTGQTFLVDGISTMIDTHLKFSKENTEVITGGENSYHKRNEEGK